MDWFVIALLSTFIFGFVNIMDSYLLSRRLSGLRVFLLVAACIFVPVSIVVAALNPLPTSLNTEPLLMAFGSGALRATAIIIFLYVLRTEEVSRSVPVTYIQPVIVALLAVILLGETLVFSQWLAVFIVATGAVLVSLGRDDDGSFKWWGKPLLLLLLFSLLMACADVMSKYALDYINFWQMYWINSLVMLLAILVIAFRREALEQLREVFKQRRLTALIALNEMLALSAILLFFWAIEQGQVSLVATISASRPLFVLLLVYLLGRLKPHLLLEGRLLQGKLALRTLAITMIVAGVAIIYLY
jgi:uncharacterized membrane protein